MTVTYSALFLGGEMELCARFVMGRCCRLIREIGIANVSRLVRRGTEWAAVTVALWTYVFGLQAVMSEISGAFISLSK